MTLTDVGEGTPSAPMGDVLAYSGGIAQFGSGETSERCTLVPVDCASSSCSYTVEASGAGFVSFWTYYLNPNKSHAGGYTQFIKIAEAIP